MRKCYNCKEYKDICLFPKSRSEKSGYGFKCKKCANEHNKMYKKTKNGVISSIYSAQVSNSKRRNHPRPEYSKNDFIKWIMSNPKFEELYDNWVLSGYKKIYKPSCDRLDNNKHYKLNNIQLVTWGENFNNYNADIRECVLIHGNSPQKGVIQIDKNYNIMNEYKSINDAYRNTGIAHQNISKVCRGLRKTAGGYMWRFKYND